MIILITSFVPESKRRVIFICIKKKKHLELTFEDLMYSDISDKLLHGVVLQVTVATVHLERLVADL